MRNALPVGLILIVALTAGTLSAFEWWDAIADGSFELGTPNPVWLEHSDNSGVVIKDEPDPALTGTWFARLGTADPVPEYAWIEQEFIIGTIEANLKFWWMRPVEAQNEADYFQVLIDGSIIFEDKPYLGIGPLPWYIQEVIDISPWADGDEHTVRFEVGNTGSTVTGYGSLWLVDDVEVLTRDDVPLEADFSWTPENVQAGEHIYFLDESSGGPDSWEWDFGDGYSAVDKDPIHLYSEPGEYLVTLSIFRSFDETSDTTEDIVPIGGPVIASFSWSPNSPLAGDSVSFLNETEGADTWQWDFGDGAFDEEKHPDHTFAEPGEYIVTLSATRTSDDSTDVVQQMLVVRIPIQADFTWEPSNPAAGQTVYFQDSSIGNPSAWLWDMPDGTSTIGPTAEMTFNAPDLYDVSLTVSREFGGDSESDTVTHSIAVGDIPLQPFFSWDPLTPEAGDEVQFTDLTIGGPSSWFWDFGDGATNEGPNPTHIFEEPGAYTVTLVVERESDESQESHSEIITVLETGSEYHADFGWEPLEPMVGQAVEFIDLSVGEAEEWHWDFGDGHFSDQQFPIHHFAAPGIYDVTLTVTFDQDDKTVLSVTKSIVISELPLEAEFYWIPFIPKVGERTEFNDVSRGRPDSWFWDFGDGNNSEERDPSYVFAASGQYFVTLRVGRSLDETTDTATLIVQVADPVEIDFTWEPEMPEAHHPVQFTEIVMTDVAGRLWAFGDGTTSFETNPVHIFDQPGIFRVQLWVKDSQNNVLAAVDHAVQVEPADLDIGLEIEPRRPEIGQEVHYTITGVDEVSEVQWHFGGIGCDGTFGPVACTPNTIDDCLAATFTYSTEGFKPVRLYLRTNGIIYGPVPSSVEVQPSGVCIGSPRANFKWWPDNPMVGQRVRCVDLSSGPPDEWSWTFDNGAVSDEQHATHIFDSPGSHMVELSVKNINGTDTFSTPIDVVAVDPVCGNEVCEPGETTWSCRIDCGPGEEETGRSGRQHTALVVPAAAGGVLGQNGTYWLTDATIVNPGVLDAKVVVEFVPDHDPTIVRVAGPATIPPHTAIHFDNVVEELFHTHELGSLWIDANRPVIVNTRTFNRTEVATFGQGIGGITRNDLLGDGDGEVYLVGLRQNEDFRTNLLIQEVNGSPMNARIKVFDGNGNLVTTRWISVDSRSRWQKQITSLGVDDLETGYATVSVYGRGKCAVFASVIDAITGDATSVDAVHLNQVLFPTVDKKSEEDRSHFLVAVVARTPGANDTVWRSEVSVLNPVDEEQQLEIRYVPTSGEIQSATIELPAAAVLSSLNVIQDVFPEAQDGAGALHIYGDSGLIVNSRTYNLLPDDATVGQSIPGLATGDMARPGEVWLVDSLKQTEDFRCNMGFAEFEGSDAEVTVVLFDINAATLRYLASKTYTVPAFGQFQVNRIFSDMELEGEYPNALAYVSVATDTGALYLYASVVDNGGGDGTTVLGKRQ
ncbi:MAG: PKD domain-containing protein [Thermoanaerobaculales bacterium]|nr:PKD domain-containing protein [Thermoanaerobaculales bacterium]